MDGDSRVGGCCRRESLRRTQVSAVEQEPSVRRLRARQGRLPGRRDFLPPPGHAAPHMRGARRTACCLPDPRTRRMPLERVGDSSLVPTSWILGLASEPSTARPLAPPVDRQARIIEQVTRPQQSRVSRRSSTASSIATWLGGRTSARHAKAWTRISELRALDGIPGPEQRGLLSCHVSATSPALCRCSAHSRLGNARGAVPSGSSLLRLPLFLALSPGCRVLHELHCQACAGLYSLSPSRR